MEHNAVSSDVAGINAFVELSSSCCFSHIIPCDKCYSCLHDVVCEEHAQFAAERSCLATFVFSHVCELLLSGLVRLVGLQPSLPLLVTVSVS